MFLGVLSWDLNPKNTVLEELRGRRPGLQWASGLEDKHNWPCFLQPVFFIWNGKKFGSCFKNEMGCQWDNSDALMFFSLFFFLLKVIVSSMSGYEAVNVYIYLVSGCIYILKSTLPESPNKFLKIRVKFTTISIDQKSLSVDTSPRSQVIRLVSVFQSHVHSPTDMLSLGEFNTFHMLYTKWFQCLDKENIDQHLW